MQLYKISFSTTHKIYIGISSRSAKKRLSAHTSPSTKSLIATAIRKHGNPILEVLYETDSWEELCNKEVEYIAAYNSIAPNGYNISLGGEGSLGVLKSEETRRKMSNALKGRTLTEAQLNHLRYMQSLNVGKPCKESTRVKISMAQKGKVVSDKTKAKLKEVNIGRKHSNETKNKISEGLRGRVCTKETRAKLSEAHKNRPNEIKLKYMGRIVSKDTRQKIGDKHRGKVVTKEAKQKMSDAAKNRPPVTEATRLKRSLALKKYHANKQIIGEHNEQFNC